MRRNSVFVLVLLIISLCIPQLAAAQSYREEGLASWYGPEFDGRPTASGEIFNSTLFTAAHPTLPFGTFLIVTNKNNNRQITVKVNDRGPFVASRIIDLSKAAAEHLDMIVSGTAPVIIETLRTSYLTPPEVNPATPPPPAPPEPVPALVIAETPPPVAPPSVEPPAPAPAFDVSDLMPVPPPAPVTESAASSVTAAPAVPGNSATPPPYVPPITINVYSPSQVTQPQAVPSKQPSSQMVTVLPPMPPIEPKAPQAPVQSPNPRPPEWKPPVTPPAVEPPPVQPSNVQPQAAPYPPVITPSPVVKTPELKPPPPITPAPVAEVPRGPRVKFVPAITPASDKRYRLQAGSFKIPRYAVEAFDKLKAVGLNPAYEQNGEFYRVIVTGVPGADMETVANQLDKAGFFEVIIREER